MRIHVIFLAAFLIFSESYAQTEPGIIRLDFPPEADPVHVGKLITKNLLSRDYMLRADKSKGTRAITPTFCSLHAGKSSSLGFWSKIL